MTDGDKISRGEELRRKFQEKARLQAAEREKPIYKFSKELLRYISDNYDATGHNSRFEQRMYDKYVQDGEPELEAWLRQNTSQCFLYDTVPPKWIYEPDWCFEDGEPLTFVHQFSNAEDRGEFYIFRRLVPVEVGPRKVKGKQAFYKILVHYRDGRSEMKGQLTSL